MTPYDTFSDRAPVADEGAIVDRARHGDHAAFAILVERYGAMVVGLAYASTLSRSEAEDIAQETFLSAWRGLPGFRGEAAFSTWLYGLARSRCVDRARRAGVRPRLSLHDSVPDLPAGASSGPSDDERRTARAILGAAGRLSLAKRQAVLMRDVQGLSYEEIASIQDVAVGTVRSRIAAARRAIVDEVGGS